MFFVDEHGQLSATPTDWTGRFGPLHYPVRTKTVGIAACVSWLRGHGTCPLVIKGTYAIVVAGLSKTT